MYMVILNFLSYFEKKKNYLNLFVLKFNAV